MLVLRSAATLMLLSSTAMLGAASLSEAQAATTYLVQLGSFGSEKQASDHWQQVKKRFPDLLGALSYQPKTVKMPPDNVTYVRTQAGPLPSRADAEAVCDDLQVTGLECYVVETALSTGKKPAEVAKTEDEVTPAKKALQEAVSEAKETKTAKEVAAVAQEVKEEAKPVVVAAAAAPEAVKAEVVKKEEAPIKPVVPQSAAAKQPAELNSHNRTQKSDAPAVIVKEEPAKDVKPAEAKTPQEPEKPAKPSFLERLLGGGEKAPQEQAPVVKASDAPVDEKPQEVEKKVAQAKRDIKELSAEGKSGVVADKEDKEINDLFDAALKDEAPRAASVKEEVASKKDAVVEAKMPELPAKAPVVSAPVVEPAKIVAPVVAPVAAATTAVEPTLPSASLLSDAPSKVKDEYYSVADAPHASPDSVSLLDKLNKRVSGKAEEKEEVAPVAIKPVVAEAKPVVVEPVKKLEAPVEPKQEAPVKVEVAKKKVEEVTKTQAPQKTVTELPWKKSAPAKPVSDASTPPLFSSEKAQPQALTMNAPAPEAKPQTPAPVMTMPTPRLGNLAAQMPRVSNPTDAKVEVSEAIRVPLSTMPLPDIQAKFDAKRSDAPAQETSIFNAKADLWAEISSFPDQNSALGYWQTLRERTKDVLSETIRVKVTRPFLNHRNNTQMSLRVGPFNSQMAIRQLCDATKEEQLQCKTVKEFDESSTSTGTISRFDRSQRYYQMKYQMGSGWTPLGSGVNMSYYVQLGVFSSPLNAQQKWEDLKASHEAVFAGVSEQIISPRFSSSTAENYRLRAGPFGSNYSAVNACEQLRRDGILCAVVTGN